MHGGSLAAMVVRAAVYGVYMVWHFVLVFQGSADMARMPTAPFRSTLMPCFVLDSFVT